MVFKRKKKQNGKYDASRKSAYIADSTRINKTIKWNRSTKPISKSILFTLYTKKSKSMKEIAEILGCSLHKVSYWMGKHSLSRRTISDAVYKRANPNGDPFSVRAPHTPREWMLLGMGLGLYWGEGTKSDASSVRLGNTDPKLIKTFLSFLKTLFGVDAKDCRFGLQIFSDINPETAVTFWSGELGVNPSQFQKVVITRPRGRGTYRHKLEYGVLTVYYHNKKLRNIIMNELRKQSF